MPTLWAFYWATSAAAWRARGDDDQAAVASGNGAGIRSADANLFPEFPIRPVFACRCPDAFPGSVEGDFVPIGLRVAEPSSTSFDAHVRLPREAQSILAGRVVTDTIGWALAFSLRTSRPIIRHEQMENAE